MQRKKIIGKRKEKKYVTLVVWTKWGNPKWRQFDTKYPEGFSCQASKF
jgi:hypothetical protein